MCEFFSFCGDGHGTWLYSDWAKRKALIKAKRSNDSDSHAAILTAAGIPAANQDQWSMYEYNPLTKAFTTDRMVEGHEEAAARGWVESVPWETIVPALVIKPIVHPFRDRNRKQVTARDKVLLRNWASVRTSVWASVWASVRTSVWASVGASVRTSVGASVGASVGTSVWASVGDSVRDSVRTSVWASVGDSVWDSVWAYISSFVAIQYRHDFSSCVALWERGLVPSFDGKTWRLQGGPEARVLYEMEAES